MRITVLVNRAVLVAGALLSSAALAQMKEGNWQVSMQMQIEGMPAMPPTTVTQCITAKDMVPDMSTPEMRCVVRDQKTVGNTVSWKMTCKGNDMTVDGEGIYRFGPGTYDGDLKSKMTMKDGPPMSASYKLQGKHLGPCTADPRKARRPGDY